MNVFDESGVAVASAARSEAVGSVFEVSFSDGFE